jgi:hypothetical protein
LKAESTEIRLLHAMGSETANIHLGTPTARKPILAHMKKQKDRWLHAATEAMVDAIRDDWMVWKERGYD